jgi:transcriptional regulator with XRE-family HTH domain
MKIPFMNARSPEKWEADRTEAKYQIITWLSEVTNAEDLRLKIETTTQATLENLIGRQSLKDIILSDPRSLTVLRSLTRRDIGTSQMATFLGITTNNLESLEAGRKSPINVATDAEVILLKELDHSLSSWITEAREPTDEEMNRTLWIASDRMLRRSTSTSLRYQHEPRQLAKLEQYLQGQGYVAVESSSVKDLRRGMPKGSYAFRVNVEGQTSDGLALKQTVDALIKPFSPSDDLLPIFLEAKSMTDEVNPNKRQKEEAQKVESARRRWQTPEERLNFVLLLGGTVPKRYLQVEAGSDLDWVWEHRVEDLQILLDWYKAR